MYLQLKSTQVRIPLPTRPFWFVAIALLGAIGLAVLAKLMYLFFMEVCDLHAFSKSIRLLGLMVEVVIIASLVHSLVAFLHGVVLRKPDIRFI